MERKQFILGVVLGGALGGAIALGAYKLISPDHRYESLSYRDNAVLSGYLDTTTASQPQGLNFISAADFVRPAVVHIKTMYEVKESASKQNQQMDPFLREFFGDDFGGQFRNSPQQPQEAAGSGVILSQDGYIVTNNHVIEKADKIKVILDDKRSYEAKLIGTDPTTDLALLKIDEKDLPYVNMGNSDKVKVGEWVLAVGNPFDLTSTVTAGIVSAKARNINILRNKSNYAVESFIQTDAAVNPGNSGGALVDLNGRLIGINTAIATPTGTFAGYSFAVPSQIVMKVVEDLKQYGEVQRGLLGINIQDVTAELAKEKNIKDIKGVYVAGVNENSAAIEAGIKEGDVITKVADVAVNSTSELQEAVARHRPGDKVVLTYSRKGEMKTATAVLKNKMGKVAVVKKETLEDKLGAEFAELTDKDKEKYNLQSGVKVTKLRDGKLKEAGVLEGYVITKFNDTKIKSKEDMNVFLENTQSKGVLIECKTPSGPTTYKALNW
ncbi:MAG: Do family serine endopeptidase [Cytophagales bacterium]